MILLIIFSFIAGFVTILSPCILPVLPIVLSGSLVGGHRRPLGIVTGFILSFSLFTLFLSVIVRATGISSELLRNISVVIVLLFGLSLLLPNFQILIEKLFTRLSSLVSRNSAGSTGFWSGLVLGLSLGLVWTPCVGPIIASVITLAAANSVNGAAILITFAYASGTAIPMLAITYGGRQLLQKVPWLLRNTANIQKTFGVLMILTAIALFFGFDRTFQVALLEKFPQYGAGLTSLEDNSLVRSTLKSLHAPTIDKSKLGKPMDNPSSYPQAPELIVGGDWFNSEPLKLQQLRGKVVLIDFWTYTCINCIRTLPYLKSWDAKYRDKGLVIIGVHTPEFEFEKKADNVKKAVADFQIKYPVMQDNDYATWNAYSNQYWPAHYLIDKNGQIRDTHFGEGKYDETEMKIQELLKETGAKVAESVKNPTYNIETLSPETYLGLSRFGSFASPEEPVLDRTAQYTLPDTLPLNSFAFSGSWTIGAETSRPGQGSALEYRFNAKRVYLVITTNGVTSEASVLLDGQVVDTTTQGDDVTQGTVVIRKNKLYNLIKLQSPGEHLLRLEFLDDKSSVYAFTFG
jgi:cytochrome c biogenesis protein CcdA/thiol-disulfide isomerase/thioredoxin